MRSPEIVAERPGVPCRRPPSGDHRLLLTDELIHDQADALAADVRHHHVPFCGIGRSAWPRASQCCR